MGVEKAKRRENEERKNGKDFDRFSLSLSLYFLFPFLRSLCNKQNEKGNDEKEGRQLSARGLFLPCPLGHRRHQRSGGGGVVSV